MAKTDCNDCKHGSRHYALDALGNPIPKDWSEYKDNAPEMIDQVNFWTYLVCAKNTFSITSACNKFARK